MIVTHQGGESFKISQGDLTIALNPQSKTSADITLFSGSKSETAEKSGFVIDGPGEYEIKDVFIKGFLSQDPSNSSGQAAFNTIYLINFEGMKLCFLTGAQMVPEEIDDIDILFVPVTSYKLAVTLEPSIMIPMNYDKNSLAQFLKEGGGDKIEPIEKFVVKKKDLEGKESEIVVLKEE